jgi:stress responsive alpha/beta barrel protein
MIRHILLLQPRSESTPQAIESCREAIASLVGLIPGLVNCHWGENLVAAERREGFTHGFTMDFTDRPSLDAYGPHPAHKPVSALVRATFERIVVLDFEL